MFCVCRYSSFNSLALSVSSSFYVSCHTMAKPCLLDTVVLLVVGNAIYSKTMMTSRFPLLSCSHPILVQPFEEDLETHNA